MMDTFMLFQSGKGKYFVYSPPLPLPRFSFFSVI
jgi:hypothetical protein